MAKKALIVDLDKCIGCHSCSVVCKQENDVNLGVFYNKVTTMGPNGRYPDLEMYYLPRFCQQCLSPECIDVCPTGASYRRSDGVVLIDKATCIGCESCIPACPYDVRTLDPERGVVEKCTLCSQLIDVGDKPACVKICPGKARIFGDLDDPKSDVSVALKAAGAKNTHQLADVGNKPVSRYILRRFKWINSQ